MNTRINITVETDNDRVLPDLQAAVTEGYGILLGLNEGQGVVLVEILDAEEAP